MHMSYKGSFIRKYLIFLLCQRYHIPTLVHLHGSEFQKWYQTLNPVIKHRVNQMLRDSNSVIVLGDFWKTTIDQIESRANTIIIRNAIKIPQECVVWNDKKFRIIFLGVLNRRKGTENLIRAFEIIKDSDKLNKIELVIAGSGPEEKYLKILCKERKLDCFIKFLGWVDSKEKRKLLKTGNLLVLPSYNEGLPISILEAISYGIPVVATNVGDIASAVFDGKNGYLVQPGDIMGLAEAILKIISDPSKYQDFSNQSKYIAKSKFSEENFFQKMLQCYLAIK
ncbi:glycosyl transferase, group 1 [Lachnospiraceae bacterium TWA4]|nr:glycosyl transferase, group 1 [Lachnospiraceae bacterium TWA4]